MALHALRPPLSPSATSPPRGGRLRAQPHSPIFSIAEASGAPKLPISPLEGEMPGRAEGVGTS
ncbi:MAG: propionyl-coenzyme A carboxylase alpha polypeptide [Mesorhizobium sp.]|nr:MAG: propionyl-coenzyme A carboxylase alpha polypeptide [Mesorhizobium sp.]TIP45698.1 MAG: propionyl-coenzyme A carboxylase alpha polypeptide [Mesorhizobium sp.]